MPVTVVVGGQFGSEGKGKVAYFLAKEKKASMAVRVGGSNSGHTIVKPNGKKIIFRHLPTPAILSDTICILPSGSYIDIDILKDEIEKSKLSSNRLLIDPRAVVISKSDHFKENNEKLNELIGSTLSGTGSGVISRIKRTNSVKLAKDDPFLQSYLQDTIPFMRRNIERGERIIIEGTQGYGLSVLHSPYYPFATSRDTTAAGFVSETGLSPLDVDEVVLTLRAFPIRVSGNSGPLPNEINWDIVTKESGSSEKIIEFTSVTKKVRRVACFDKDIVLKAILANKPTCIVLNHLDYIDSKCRLENKLTEEIQRFIREVESQIGLSIEYFGINEASLYKRKQLTECLINARKN